MKSTPIPANESDRLNSLQEHQLLDTLPEEVYDDITKLASEITGTPISLLTLVDENRLWFKSKQGVDINEVPREQAFCAHAIMNPDEVLIIPDLRYDERFQNNPIVTGESNIIFYAGAPVKGADGYPFGSICVMDNRPRELSDQKVESLKALAKLVNAHFELRKTKIEIEAHRNALSKAKTVVQDMQNITGALLQNTPKPDLALQLADIQVAVASLHALMEDTQKP